MPEASPSHEAHRLKALARYSILDSEPEEAFDDLARLASQLCGTPIALVSLVDEARQWSKARVGIDTPQTPREQSFCVHAIQRGCLLVIPDAAADERFAANPLVTGEPGIQFYAGSPLISPDGFALGTLCVIDRVPRGLSPEQAAALEALSRQVVAQLELRLRVTELQAAAADMEGRVRERTAELDEQAGALRRAEEGYRGIFENAAEGIYQTSPEGRMLQANPALAKIYGYETPAELKAELDDVARQLYVEAGRREEFRRLVGERGTVAGFESRVRRKDGEIIWIRESGRAVRGPDGVLQHYEGLVEDVTERRRAEDKIRGLNAELERAYDATIEGWSRALDLRDKETEGHSRRVTDMSLRLARVLGLSGGALVHIRRGALLHDIGKLGVPDAVLLKPGALTEPEWEVMRRHPTYAHDWLATIPVLRPAIAIPHAHHERWDGTGYPRGLAGEAIPLAARLFAAVDIWDALRSDRPYRRAWPEARVREHLRTLAGNHLDPVVVEAFLQLLDGAEATGSRETAELPSEATESPTEAAGRPKERDRLEQELVAASVRVRDLERANARLGELAATDELTGLRNRRHLREALEAACAGALRDRRALSLMLLDLDGFKAYNDAHGHPAGDEVLRGVAEVMRAHVRPCDIAARHGGEEFAVLMPATGAEGAVACAERLRAAIAARLWPLTPVTASFGVATMSRALDASELIEQADRALYRAKRRGRDRVEHHEDLPSRLSLAV